MYFQSKARNEGETGIREQPGAEKEKRAENGGQKKTGGRDGGLEEGIWRRGRKANEKRVNISFVKA